MGVDENWKRNRQLAPSELRDGETLRALFPALTSTQSGGHGIAPAWLLPALIALERWQWHRAARQPSKSSLFPLAPRMVIAVTDARLLVWAARRRWLIGAFRGYITLDRIVLAETITVGAGWRSIRIHLATEQPVRLRVPARGADDLASLLSRGGSDSGRL